MTETTTAPLSETGYCAQCGEPAFFKRTARCYGCANYDQVIAVAKALHVTILNVMRGKDRDEAVRALRADAEAAEARLDEARKQTPGMEAAEQEAIAEERAADDRARQAAKHHSKRARELERAEDDKSSTDELLEEAGLRATLTAQAAAKRAGEHEKALTAKRDAEAKLTAHQAHVARLENAAATARLAADNPPVEVPVSAETAFTVWPFTVASSITDKKGIAAGALRGQIAGAAQLVGLDEEYLAQGRAEGREAAAVEAARRPGMAADAHGNLTVTGPTTRFLQARGNQQ